ncbi:MAG: hypothetical protein N2111_10565 [Candidatus Sumerlaeaceae bacterium]|nr:hypothetical protein [Candidatus Sumerlaeaceae bacterium]
MSRYNLRALMATLAICALVMPAALSAQSSDPTTSGPFVIGKVTVKDPRILDVTGTPYEFDGVNHDIVLGLVQDPRGNLISTGVVTLSEGTTRPVRLTGRLNVISTGPLTFVLHNQPFQPQPPQPAPASDVSMTPTSGPLLIISGVLAGPEFRCRVVAKDFAPGLGEEFDAPLLPKKPVRGFVVQPAPVRQIAPGVFVSLRRIDLPWGQILLPAVQRPALGKGIVFQIPDQRRKGTPVLRLPFGLEVVGMPDGLGGFQVDMSRVMLPYGMLLVPPADTEVLPLAPLPTAAQ